MTVLTLVQIKDEYFILADKDGVIMGDYSLESAQAKLQNHNYNMVKTITYAHWRLYEVVGSFEQSVDLILPVLADYKLMAHKDMLYQITYLYKLQDDIGKQWFDNAIVVA